MLALGNGLTLQVWRRETCEGELLPASVEVSDPASDEIYASKELDGYPTIAEMKVEARKLGLKWLYDMHGILERA